MEELKRQGDELRKERIARHKREKNLRDKYLELVTAVQNTKKGESRHDTVLRYVREAEETTIWGKAKALASLKVL
jgi:hypothetical protein